MPPRIRRIRTEDIFGVPWALREDVLSRLAREVALLAEQGISLISAATQHVDGAALLALDGPHEGAVRVGSVSVVPIYDVIENHSDWISELFGATTVDGLRATLTAELNDPNVRAIVLDIDSPGGTVAGITEFCAEIRAARGGVKPIIAVANTLAASAAYWIASQADEVIVSPSGSVGSVGVYAIHQEVSRMLDEMGVTTTIISFGPHKTEGNEFEPLTDDAKSDIQGRVDVAGTQFLADVAAGRRVPVDEVANNYGGGRVLVAKQAVAAGMADRVGTLAQTVARLNRAAGGPTSRTRASALLLDLEASAIGRHTTPTTDDAWDGPANEARLPSPMTVEQARSAYAWMDESKVEE